MVLFVLINTIIFIITIVKSTSVSSNG